VSEIAKYFAQRLNDCLDETGAPAQVRERVAILSKMLNLPKQQAWGFLEGLQLPNSEQLAQIATEFEVEVNWLSGKE
jgi:hypothetical protein